MEAPENTAAILRLRIQLQNTTDDVKNFNTNLQVASASCPNEGSGEAKEYDKLRST